ncbi:MAG TPA: hypothetical protein QGI39_06085 [Gammaproteobacteria bacterium]|jgi:hypothetical protein|nr:hypothetical protein [Gammaproteobacteria bacterium]|tara:strand:- start:801 stop:962 length:162 start_codon:yes stop_codon:yes gene_type:complete
MREQIWLHISNFPTFTIATVMIQAQKSKTAPLVLVVRDPGIYSLTDPFMNNAG